MKRRITLPLCILGMAFAAPALAADYSITDLGTLGGSQSEAYGINNADQVVGWSYDGGANMRAFVWQTNSGMANIGTLAGGSTIAYGINNNGQVVGWSPWPTSTDSYHAFLWQSGSGTMDLGTLGGSFSGANAINNNGQVVGISMPPGNTRDAAFSWQNGVMVDLGTIGVSNAQATAINDPGTIAGIIGNRAYIWKNGATTDLGTLGGSNSSPTGINIFDQVVGNSNLPGGNLNAFLWQNGVMTDIGTLGGPASNSNAHGINAHGVVVGESETLVSGQSHAFIWQEGIGMTDLNNLLQSNSGWDLTAATAINDSGAIAGFGTINGQRHAFLMTPVPIPAAFWLFGSGLLGLIGVARAPRFVRLGN